MPKALGRKPNGSPWCQTRGKTIKPRHPGDGPASSTKGARIAKDRYGTKYGSRQVSFRCCVLAREESLLNYAQVVIQLQKSAWMSQVG